MSNSLQTKIRIQFTICDVDFIELVGSLLRSVVQYTLLLALDLQMDTKAAGSTSCIMEASEFKLVQILKFVFHRK